MVLTTIFIPIAVKLGFRDQQLIALLIMLGSPTTPSSYVMAKNMGHEGDGQLCGGNHAVLGAIADVLDLCSA